MAAPPESASPTAPKPVELPAVSDFLSDSQWRVLMALMDTVVPAIKLQDTGPVAQQQDLSVLYLPSSQYSEKAASLRQAASPLDPSAELIEAYLAERPSDNPLFAQVLKCVLSSLPPSKKRELRFLLSILR